jgi:hypothetical protein
MRIILFALSTIVVLSSCNHFRHGERVDGNGTIQKQNRKVTSNFTGIEVDGDIELYIRQDSSRSIDIETDENLLPYVFVVADGDMLRIHPERGYDLEPTKSVKVYVSGPTFKELYASGACKMIGETEVSSTDQIEIKLSGSCDAGLRLKTPKVIAHVTGASRMTLRGETKDVSIEASGASDAKCFDLMSESSDVDVSGASNAEVFASVKLDADASGASGVRYKGNATVNKHESGASSVKKAD